MKVTLLVVGKTTDKHFQAGIDDYSNRIAHYAPFQLEVIPELKSTKAMSQAEQKEREGKLILGALQAGDYVVLLDERGKEHRSIEFAQWIQKRMLASTKRLVFVVGGPYGFSPEVYARCDEKISLSRMTFSHQMIRLIFTEQIYRAFTILKGENYHHE